MDGTAVLDAARDDIVAARRARHHLLIRVRELQDSDAAAATGYRSTTRLIQQLWNLDPAAASRLVADAESLCPRSRSPANPCHHRCRPPPPPPHPVSSASTTSGSSAA